MASAESVENTIRQRTAGFTIPAKLQAMNGSITEAIADLLQASPDANTRSVVATGLVFSLWQNMSRRQTPRYPSLLFLRENTQTADPVDSCLKGLATEPSAWKPEVQKSGPFAYGSPELAPQEMCRILAARKKTGPLTLLNKNHIEGLAEAFFAAQQTGFGRGQYRPYSQSWQEEFGFLSDPDEGVILRLESDRDKERFIEHLHSPKLILERGDGIGSGLVMKPKPLALSGSLKVSDWDAVSANRLTFLTRPVICLPHLTDVPIISPTLPRLEYLFTIWGARNPLIKKVSDPSLIPNTALASQYLEVLRHRLIHLNSSYDYSIQRLVRELFSVCQVISKVAATSDSQDTKIREEPILWDLYHNTLRSIAIGVEALTWHRIGFPSKDIDADANKVLTILRDHQSLSPRDIQRKARLSSASLRDRILENLELEGLAKVEGKSVQATAFTDFTEALYQNPKFPAPPSCWQLLQEKQRKAE